VAEIHSTGIRTFGTGEFVDTLIPTRKNRAKSRFFFFRAALESL
jgi:hypothetical protein